MVLTRILREKLGVAIGDLNERIAVKLDEFETDDLDVEQRLERELKRDYHIITADKRLDQVARDFVQHYSTAWETGKAMLVCIDKVTCVRMHKYRLYWDEVTGLPVDAFAEADVQIKAEDAFRHVYRAYPTVPSPNYIAMGWGIVILMKKYVR